MTCSYGDHTESRPSFYHACFWTLPASRAKAIQKKLSSEPEARICTLATLELETTTIVEESRTGKRDSMAPPAGMGGPI